MRARSRTGKLKALKARAAEQPVVHDEDHGGADGRAVVRRWGLSWQITPRALTDALAAGGGEAKRAFEAMMKMKKIDIAAIEAARRG